MTRRNRIFLALFVALLSVGVDQATKAAADKYLRQSGELSLAGETIRLDYNVNKGGVFSFE